MRERNEQYEMLFKEKRLLDVNEVCAYLSLGRCKGVEFAKEIGAEIKIGRRALYDKNKIDKYLDEIAES